MSKTNVSRKPTRGKKPHPSAPVESVAATPTPGPKWPEKASKVAFDLWSTDLELLTAMVAEENRALSEHTLRIFLDTLSGLRKGLLDLGEQIEDLEKAVAS